MKKKKIQWKFKKYLEHFCNIMGWNNDKREKKMLEREAFKIFDMKKDWLESDRQVLTFFVSFESFVSDNFYFHCKCQWLV